MATEQRRFTISVTPDMEIDLDAAKKERYYKDTRNEMIKDLIARGLDALKAENEVESRKGEDRQLRE